MDAPADPRRPVASLLAGMTRQDLSALAPFLKRVVVPAGRAVLDARTRTRALVLVESGIVDVVREGRGGQRTPVATVAAGQSLGEVALVDGRPRRAAALARVDASCLVLEREGLEALRGEHPATAVRLLQNLGAVLAGRLHHAWKRLAPPPVPVDPVRGRRP